MNVLIIGANGHIARLIEQGILSEVQFDNINLTLLLRNKSRLTEYQDNPRVKLIEGDARDAKVLKTALTDIDLVYVAFADNFASNGTTAGIIKAMDEANVSRVLVSSSIGVYHEEPNADFAKWNEETIGDFLPGLRESAKEYVESDLNYTIMRYVYLNDRDEVKYKVTTQGENFAGGSVSRKSVADMILTIIKDSTLYIKEAIGISDPSTKDNVTAVF
ncbi:NAD(P)H-binding protein [Companilactobacillus crustorum]|uniref:NAD(P)H-binding protein n=1 Tax=Companilactobacillus crustorum TaxID=392416 RepID=UPI0018DD2A0F|nr:NAD(P)H-binding protein [Companilactobacillus crustorum]WDT65597.1 NAD(P)H-binding protein [Companilactobacillus crustorum]